MLNLLRNFIRILRRIFHIRSKPQYETEEIPSETSTEKMAPEVKQYEGESLGIPPEKEIKIPQVSKEGPSEPLSEETASEISDIKKIQKPYIKKLPTESKEESERSPEEKNRRTTPRQKRKRELGKIRKRRLKPTNQAQKITKGTEKESDLKKLPLRIQSPFIEIDLNEAKVFFVIPKQHFKSAATTNSAPQELRYEVGLNQEKYTLLAKVNDNKQGIREAEEVRKELKKPLESFKVIFPHELQKRIYTYKHTNKAFYAFVGIRNECGRLYYLYDEQGGINPLPRKCVWILIREGFELDIEPDTIEERWVWENYQPLSINLKETKEIVLKNYQTNEEKRIPCWATFSIESEKVIEDDFNDQTPLFVGENINLKAPRVNSNGWMVWLQNRKGGYKIVTENWTGAEPLELKIPSDLPCECGEYQLDICEQDDRMPIETLFFRYIPFLRLKSQRELVLPDSNRGHGEEVVEVLFERDFQEWNLELDDRIYHKCIENGYQIKLLPEQDSLQFSLMKKGKTETRTSLKITIPRLKWRTSKDKGWYDRPVHIRKDKLITGADFYLTVCTNDFNTKYDLSAILETNGQRLQEAKFIRKATMYNLLLNQFYDTLQKINDKLVLKMEVRRIREQTVIGQIDVVYFPEILGKKPASIKPIRKEKILRPIVKGGNGKLRKGRGFSRQEITKAGIDMDDIRRLHIIPFDKRRKSMYSENVEILKLLLKGGQGCR